MCVYIYIYIYLTQTFTWQLIPSPIFLLQVHPFGLLFYLAFDPGHLEHTVLTEKILTLVFCLSHPFWPCPAQSLLTQVQSLQKGKVKTADVERAREELRVLMTAIRAALDHNDRWGGWSRLVCAGITLLLLDSLLFHYWSQSVKCSLEEKLWPT